MYSDYLFQVTSKITLYFQIYNKISEQVTLFSHLLIDISSVPILREIENKCRGTSFNLRFINFPFDLKVSLQLPKKQQLS